MCEIILYSCIFEMNENIRYYKLSFLSRSFRNARAFNKCRIKHDSPSSTNRWIVARYPRGAANESKAKGMYSSGEANIFTQRSPACRPDFARPEGFMRRSIITVLDPSEFVLERRAIVATENLCSCRLSLILRDSTKRAKTSVCAWSGEG